MMEKFYYALSIERDGGWDTAPQYEIEAVDYIAAARYCRGISMHLGCEVRLSRSKGFNNQGYYLKSPKSVKL